MGVLYTPHMVEAITQTPPAPGTLTPEDIYARLDTVMDPELGISIVKLGLIYNVIVQQKKDEAGQLLQMPDGKPHYKVRITMTLTTPGCPLAAVFDGMVKDSLFGLPGVDVDHDVWVELTFDPPWVADMMDEEAKAELGF